MSIRFYDRPAELVQDAFYLIGVGALDVRALLAEAFTPNLQDADTVTWLSADRKATVKFATAQEAPALIEIHAIPLCWEQPPKVLFNDTFTVIRLHSIQLAMVRLGCDVTLQIQLLSGMIAIESLGPHLVDLRQLPRMVLAEAGHVNRPEAAVSGYVPKETVI